MPHEVIMPALGMAQETGRIVSWLKEAGQSVAAGEPIMEVETDKAVMEVEAAVDGILSDIRAEAGEDVPVGDVVAVISDDGTAVAAPKVRKTKPEPKSEPAAALEVAKAPAKAVQAPTVASAGDRILASPKARRLAKERGLDLTQLVAAGHPQPYHVADLSKISATTANSVRIEARASASALSDLGDGLSSIAASFAARLLRRTGDDTPIHVQLESPGQKTITLADPDHLRGGPVQDGAPALILRDLTATSLQRLPTNGPVPTLTLAHQGGAFLVALDFCAGAMSAAAAEDLVTQFTARLEDPLTHLL